MPIYEYECGSCGERFEKLVRFSDADLKFECPGCQSKNTQKKVAAAASFIFSVSLGTTSSCGGGGRFT
jgi:putative FmdB family regulatory protein